MRRDGMHVAGILISKSTIPAHVPIQRLTGYLITWYDFPCGSAFCVQIGVCASQAARNTRSLVLITTELQLQAFMIPLDTSMIFGILVL